jgi:hypothetical protein
MAHIQAELWLHDARQGKELTTEERRYVVSWLVETSKITTAEMALLFKVHERTITSDRDKARDMLAEAITSEDPKRILADTRMVFDNAMRRIEKGLKKAKPGTRTYLDYVLAQTKLQTEYNKTLQEFGFLPKNLGTMTTESYSYKATVGLDADNQRSMNLFDKPTITAEIVEAKAITDGKDSSKTVGDVSAAGRAKGNIEQGGDAAAPTSTQLPAVQVDPCLGGSLPPTGSTT